MKLCYRGDTMACRSGLTRLVMARRQLFRTCQPLMPSWIRRSSSATNVAPVDLGRALYVEGSAMLDDRSASSNEATGADLVRAAADAGFPAARGRLGHWRLFGHCGESRDAEAAVPLLREAAKGGDATSQFWLGRLLCDVGAFGAQADATPAPARPRADPAAAAVVFKHIREMRRVAVANRSRRARGLQPLPLPAAAPVPATPEGEDQGGATAAAAGRARLASDPAQGRAWLLAAAAQDSADAQVLLGNMSLAAAAAAGDAGEARALAREGFRWYGLAAHVDTVGPDPAGGGDDGGPLAVVASPPPPPLRRPAALAEGAHGGAGDAPSESPAPPTLSQLAGDVLSAAAAAATATVADGAGGGGPPPHPDALFNLASAYLEGYDGVLPADPARAAALFGAAAALGDAPAQLWLGHAQRVGGVAGVRRDPPAGRRLLELAAGAGHGPALLYLARLHREGDPALRLRPDPRRTRYFLEAAADAGDADALAELGSALYSGLDGCTPDPVAARARFSAAAELGHADAMVCAGAMCLRGEGGPADGAAALALYTRAAEGAGHSGAWENLAALHATGSPDGAVAPNLRLARYIRDHILPALEKARAEAQEAEAAAAAAAGVPQPDQTGTASGCCGGGCGRTPVGAAGEAASPLQSRSAQPSGGIACAAELPVDSQPASPSARLSGAAATDELGVIDLRHV